jgi:zinc finger HIT domain-containing protein 1
VPSQPTVSTPAAPAVRATPTLTGLAAAATAPHLTSKGTRSHKKKDLNTVSTPTPLRKVSTASQSSTPLPIKSEPSQDIPMPDAPLLSQGNSTIPTPHPGDKDPLLVSRIPTMPAQEEIEKLLAAPPMTYNEARGPWVYEDRMKPIRQFCEVCGYWGRVKCKGCGGRVCALECLQVHQEECFTRYGA